MPTPVDSSSPIITYGHIQDAVVGGIRDMILNGHLCGQAGAADSEGGGDAKQTES